MKINRNALGTVLVYLVLFAVAFLAGSDIAPDEFLLEEGTHATYITAPFSVLFTLVLTFAGVEIFESTTWAYVIWFASAALNSVAIYMLSSRVYAMLGSELPTQAVGSHS